MRAWTVKPPFGTPINRAHPLAQGLIGAFPVNEGGGRFVWDAVTGLAGTTRDGSTPPAINNANPPIWLVTPYGPGVQYGGGSFQLGYYISPQALTQGFSLAFMWSLPTPTSGQNGIFGTAANGIEVRINAGKIDLLKCTVADMGSSSTVWSANTLYHGGVSYDGATGRFYLNGNPDGVISSVQTFSPGVYYVGGAGTGEITQSGSILVYCYLWNRVLSAGEFQQIAANPYAMFRRRLFPASAAFAAAPVATISLSPASGLQGSTVTVTVTGVNTHFSGGTTTVSVSGGTDIRVGTVSVASATSLSVPISVSTAAAGGARTLTVRTGAEAPTATFTVTLLTQRDRIDYDQVRQAARQGAGQQFQMFGGGTPTAGHAAVYDAHGNVIDGGAALPGGANGLVLPVRVTSVSTTLATSDYCVVATAVATVTLPASPVAGQSYQIKNGISTTGSVTVSGGTIDGVSSLTLAPLASVSLIYDGTMWRQI